MIATKAAKIDNEPPFSREELKGELVAFATKLGFDSCRVAACAPPLHANEFGDWLDDGAHGEMGYMQRGEEKRSDPQKVLPGARSIIVLALNYFQGAMEAARPRAAEARPHAAPPPTRSIRPRPDPALTTRQAPPPKSGAGAFQRRLWRQ